MGDDNDDQNNELTALASMYDESMFKMHKDNDQLYCGILTARVELLKPFLVKLHEHDAEHQVGHLPPVLVSFTLPSDYPSTSPPQYSVACVWLTNDQIKKLRSKLDEIWMSSQGSVVLFMWMNFLQNDLLDSLRVTPPLLVNGETLAAILDYDQTMQNKEFAATSFKCEVCFGDKLGAMCTRFKGCGHVFCRSCVKEYLELFIEEGTVSNLKCLSPKCTSQVLPAQVKELVNDQLYERYDRLLLQRSLEVMTDVVYCPRKACQCPVLIEEHETMGSCPSCRYVFCKLCKTVYHGISPCRIQSEKLTELRETYLAADEAGRRELEQRYGRRNLQRAVEESFSQQWVEDNCKKCPQCKTRIEKKDGCNKMTCTKCHAYFCWLCLTVITTLSDPYTHFSSVGSPCFNRLFEGVIDEDNDDDMEFVDVM